MQGDLFITESHCAMILKALKGGERLTPLQILKRFDCLRASGRIYDLRNMGYDIGMDMVKTRTGKRVAEYYLKN